MNFRHLLLCALIALFSLLSAPSVVASSTVKVLPLCHPAESQYDAAVGIALSDPLHGPVIRAALQQYRSTGQYTEMRTITAITDTTVFVKWDFTPPVGFPQFVGAFVDLAGRKCLGVIIS